MADHRTPPPCRRRTTPRQRLALAARLTWKDASGAVRFISVTTRDISDGGAFVEADAGAAIPLYRLVQLQLERQARDSDGIPEALREGRVLSAVWRVAPCRSTTGTPSGYALRFLLEPRDNACRLTAATSSTDDERMAVAS